MLDRIRLVAEEHDPVTVNLIMDAFGRSSFGALMLFAGLIVLAPIIGDIPGVPTTMAAFVFLLSVQLMAKRRYFWIPRWLENRSLDANKVTTAMQKARRPAKWLDHVIKPRLTYLVDGAAIYAVATACILIALLMPPMELIPFSANIAGTALSFFGLALIGRDGVLALLAFTLTVTGTSVLAWAAF